MIVIPKLEQLINYTNNDYEVIKLANFYQVQILDKMKLVLLYRVPNVVNGMLVNVPADFGPVLDVSDTHQQLFFKNNVADLRLSTHGKPTTPKAGRIFAVVLSVNDRNVVVFKLKRPIDVTTTTNFASVVSELFTFIQGQPFTMNKFNAPYNKDERIHGFLSMSDKILSGECIAGTFKGEKPLSEEAEIGYVKQIANNITKEIPFDTIDGQYHKTGSTFTSDLSSTINNKTYQINGSITIPESPTIPPTALLVKPKSVDGIEDSLALVLFKFDGFGRGGKLNLSLIIQME